RCVISSLFSDTFAVLYLVSISRYLHGALSRLYFLDTFAMFNLVSIFDCQMDLGLHDSLCVHPDSHFCMHADHMHNLHPMLSRIYSYSEQKSLPPLKLLPPRPPPRPSLSSTI